VTRADLKHDGRHPSAKYRLANKVGENIRARDNKWCSFGQVIAIGSFSHTKLIG
jgi:hypothetical protein